MPTLAWIVIASTAMAFIALSGSITLILPGPVFNRMVLPLVALAAGSLLGGSLFHLLPEAVTLLGNNLGVYGWVAGGVVTFLMLEQYLHWHHCYRPAAAHRPLGYLILIADGFHNIIDGLAIGAAFTASTELGLVTWPVLAAHEIPRNWATSGSSSTRAGAAVPPSPITLLLAAPSSPAPPPPRPWPGTPTPPSCCPSPPGTSLTSPSPTWFPS